jgi:hypothetical protein
MAGALGGLGGGRGGGGDGGGGVAFLPPADRNWLGRRFLLWRATHVVQTPCAARITLVLPLALPFCARTHTRTRLRLRRRARLPAPLSDALGSNAASDERAARIARWSAEARLLLGFNPPLDLADLRKTISDLMTHPELRGEEARLRRDPGLAQMRGHCQSTLLSAAAQVPVLYPTALRLLLLCSCSAPALLLLCSCSAPALLLLCSCSDPALILLLRCPCSAPSCARRRGGRRCPGRRRRARRSRRC